LDGSTVSDLLAQTGRDPQRVAVEINGDICRRADYGGRTLNEGDSVEIVSLVGGG
jgi:sulfur carrier protein